MFNENEDNEINSLLPYGDNIRPLLNSSDLKEQDLKFILQKRGIFIKNSTKSVTIPEICSILLSPKEFDILKNKQNKRESNIKRSTSQDELVNIDINIINTLNLDNSKIEKIALEEDLTYTLASLEIKNDPKQDTIQIEGEISRNDWTKDIFSIKTIHPFKISIEKLPEGKIIYAVETTVDETKDFTNKILNSIHKELQDKNLVSKNKNIQKILSTHFHKNEYIFEYLISFTKKNYKNLIFKRITDIKVGIDNNLSVPYPEDLIWLKDNIEELKLKALRDKKLDKTNILKAGSLGILVFGLIETEFEFTFNDISGICFIEYGFPKFYEKKNHIEFETTISKINVENKYSHVSKESIKRFLLKEFQREKHTLFEDFKKNNKVDTEPKDINNQYIIAF